MKFHDALASLRTLVIQRLPDIRLESLSQLRRVEEIALDQTKLTLDLEQIPSLKKLSIFWHRKLFLNEAKSNVAALHMWKYRSAKGDLSDAPLFPRLSELELVQCNLVSLRGISRFCGLKKLELHNHSRLERLTEMGLEKLKVFVATDCKNITDHENLASCKMIEELKIHRCGTMKSVEFVKLLERLRSFRFVGTAIADGDYSPLLKLEDVAFTDSPSLHFKMADFRQAPSRLPEC